MNPSKKCPKFPSCSTSFVTQNYILDSSKTNQKTQEFPPFLCHYAANNLRGQWWAGLEPLSQPGNGCSGSACDGVLTWLSGRPFKHLDGIQTGDTSMVEECVRLRIDNNDAMQLFDNFCSKQYDVLCQQTCDDSRELFINCWPEFLSS